MGKMNDRIKWWVKSSGIFGCIRESLGDFRTDHSQFPLLNEIISSVPEAVEGERIDSQWSVPRPWALWTQSKAVGFRFGWISFADPLSLSEYEWHVWGLWLGFTLKASKIEGNLLFQFEQSFVVLLSVSVESREDIFSSVESELIHPRNSNHSNLILLSWKTESSNSHLSLTINIVQVSLRTKSTPLKSSILSRLSFEVHCP